MLFCVHFSWEGTKTVIPDNWNDVEIFQGNKSIQCKIKKQDGISYAVYNIIPNRGEVALEESNS